jgi:O-antigen ligase
LSAVIKTFRWCLAGTVAWGVLAFGAVYPWAYWPLAAASAALGVWAIVVARAWEDPRTVRLGIVLMSLVAAIALQALPLPYSWAAWLSPGLDRFLREYQLGFRPPLRHALSLEPEHTVVACLLALGLGLLLVGATRMIRRIPLEWFVSQLMGLAVALAVVGIVQRAFFDPAHPLVYGFWKPRYGGNPFGPFVNRNHFAGWMVMALPIVAMYAVGVLRTAKQPPDRSLGAWLRWMATVDGNRILLIAVATLVMGAALVLTGSRSGVASFAVATAVMLAFLLREIPQRRHRVAALAYATVLLGGAVAWAGSDMVFARFAASSGAFAERLEAWQNTVAIARDFPFFGVGLGSYARAMLMYQTGDRLLMYAQAHNDYLQLAADGGLLVVVPALLVLVTVVAGIRRRLRGSEDDTLTFWIRRGAVAGLLGIAAQSVMEFSLQMPGNAVLFVMLIAIGLHRPRSPHHAHRV